MLVRVFSDLSISDVDIAAIALCILFINLVGGVVLVISIVFLNPLHLLMLV